MPLTNAGLKLMLKEMDDLEKKNKKLNKMLERCLPYIENNEHFKSQIIKLINESKKD